MDSSATSSALTRYRPAILFATGLAATYGAYLVYRAARPPGEHTQPAPRLRRSNAVHRAARRRELATISCVSRDHEGQIWPDLYVSIGDRFYSYSLSHGGPDKRQAATALSVSPEVAQTVVEEAQVPSLMQIFQVISGLLPSSSEARELETLQMAVVSRDLTTMVHMSDVFTDERWRYNQDAYRAAADLWCSSEELEAAVDIQAAALRPRRSDDDDETLADSDASEARDPDQRLKGLLYHIAEEEARRTAYVHRGTRCDSCNALPIHGIRWHCLNCPDFDLCSACEALGLHPRTHVFAKIQIPISPRAQPREMHPLWYPGNPDATTPAPLSALLKKDLSSHYGFDEPRIEALYDQFFCLSKPCRQGNEEASRLGIDRTNFYRIFAGENRRPVAPNYLYDRLFDFYDEDRNGFISFPEFVRGLAYLQKPAKRRSMNRIFRAYDEDNDGYITRADVIKMLRAKYLIHKEVVTDIIAIEEAQPSAFGRNVSVELRSNRPISSMFSEAEIPQGEGRRSATKPADAYGDPQTLQDPLFGRTILPNGHTDMDVSFWEAVFDEHGRPNRLADLHPQFNDRLDARLQVRDRYTSAVTFDLGAENAKGEKYLLVPADSRGRRPLGSGETPLAEEWKQDILDFQTAGDREDQRTLHEIHENHDQLDAALERDRAFPVSHEDLPLGEEVLYQVIEDAMNEILDSLFAEKEVLAEKIQRTRKIRQKYRKEIDAFVKERDEHQIEQEVVKKLANGKAQSNRSPHASQSKDDAHASDNIDTATRQFRSQSPSPEDFGFSMDGPDEPTNVRTSQEYRLAASETEQEPDLNPVDAVAELPSSDVPRRATSLRAILTDVHDQNLEALLRAYESTLPPAGGETTAPHETGDSTTRATRDREETRQRRRRARSVTAAMGFRVEVPDSEDWSDAEEEPVRELPWTPESVTRSSGSTEQQQRQQQQQDASIVGDAVALGPAANKNNNDNDVGTHGFHAPSGTFASSYEPPYAAVEGPSAASTASADEEAADEEAADEGGAGEGGDRAPTLWQLEEWASLDREEQKVRERGGPARINLDEFEQLVAEDEESAGWGKVGLRGVVEGWLVWASF